MIFSSLLSNTVTKRKRYSPVYFVNLNLNSLYLRQCFRVRPGEEGDSHIKDRGAHHKFWKESLREHKSCFLGMAWNLYFHNLYHFFQCYRISSHKQHFQLLQFTNIIRQFSQLVIIFTQVVFSLHSLIQPSQLLQFTDLIRQCSQLVITQLQCPEILEVFNVWSRTDNWLLLALSKVRLLNSAMAWGSSLNWFTSDVSLFRFFSLLILVGNSSR